MDESLIAWLLVAWVGASIGSFLTLVTYRLPRDEKIGMSRSRCPQCSTVLRVPDLVPILSWLFARGKCRHCKTKVSARYPLIELACMIGTLLVVHEYGFTLMALSIVGLWWCIVAILATDLEHYIILDEVQIAIIVFGLLFHYAAEDGFIHAFIGAFAGLAIGLTLKYGFLYLRKKDGLGLGDVKLLFGAGLWLASAAAFVPFLFFAGLIGVVFGTLWRFISKSEVFPFGPALAAALLICMVCPEAQTGFWQLYGLIGA